MLKVIGIHIFFTYKILKHKMHVLDKNSIELQE